MSETVTINGLLPGSPLSGNDLIETMQMDENGVYRSRKVEAAAGLTPLINAAIQNATNGARALSAIRIWHGGTTSSSFVVCFDTSSTAATVGMAYGTTSDPTLATRMPDVAPTITQGTAGYYSSYKAQVTGLAPDTRYYWWPVINGVVQTGKTRRTRTFPPVGTPKSVRIMTGSCYNGAVQPSNIFRAMALDAANSPFDHVLDVFQGDNSYDDIRIDDIRYNRDRGTRILRSRPYADDLMAISDSLIQTDDHDGAYNDPNYNLVNPYRASLAVLNNNSISALKETAPIYPLVRETAQPGSSDLSLTQQAQFGRINLLLLDTLSQRNYLQTSAKTMLGTGSSPPSSWNQRQWVLDQLAASTSNGAVATILAITTTWTAAAGANYCKTPVERLLLSQAIRDCPTWLMMPTGDCHRGGIDAQNDDYTPDGSARFVNISSSPLANNPGSLADGGGPFIFNGVDTTVEDNYSLYAVMDITDNGGTDFSFTIRLKGAPFDKVTGEATVLRTITSEDMPRAVSPLLGASGTTVLSSLDGTIPLTKSGIGPATGCSVNYSMTTGQAGTAAIKPNEAVAFKPATLTAGTTGTLTISNPVRCTLGTASIPFRVAAIRKQTAAYLNQMTTLPGDPHIASIDAFLGGLYDAGLYEPDKLISLWLLKAHSKQAAYLDAISPSTYPLIEHGTVNWTSLAYVAGTGSGSYLDTQFSAYSQAFSSESNTFGAYVENDVQSSQGIMGSSHFYLNPRTTSDTLTSRDGSNNATDSTANASSVGLFSVSRTDLENYSVYKGSTLLDTYAVDVETVSTRSFWLGGWNNSGTKQYSTKQLSMGYISGGLTQAEITTLNTLFATFRAAA